MLRVMTALWFVILAMTWSGSGVIAQESGYSDYAYQACAREGCSGDWLVSTMLCESGGDPNATGIHGEIGIMQFMPSTFYAWGGSDIWNPYEQIDLAAWAFANGLSYHWLCA